MPVAPKAANNSRSERKDARGSNLRDRRRLTRPAQFAAVAQARGPQSLRSSRHWLALSGRLELQPALQPTPSAEASSLRCGLTVPKRLARRALDRNLIKRVVREAVRAAAAAIEAYDVMTLDVVVRLKTALPPVERLPRAQLRRQLHQEAHQLFEALRQEVMKRAPLRQRPQSSQGLS